MVWYIRNYNTIQATYLPSAQKSLAYSLNKQFSADPVWGTPQLGCKGIPKNRKFPPYCSRGAMSHSSQGNDLLLSWTEELTYAFPPIPLLPQVLRKIHHNSARVVLVAPNWHRQFWFSELLRISVPPPIRIHTFSDLLIQEEGRIGYRNPEPLHLEFLLSTHPRYQSKNAT